MDFDRVETLLSIAERSMKWPHLKHLHDAAMKELEATKPQEEVKKVEVPSPPEDTQEEPEDTQEPEKEERRV